tara:strand:- start:1088 stop:1711 length:624 start_codon:yes stop_codon:yes gene_type:complete
MDPQSLTVGNTQIRILPTVKGLVSESQIVEDEINSFKPELIALSIGPEEVAGTRDWDGEPYDMSGWDEVYGLSLRKLLGDNSVRLPPPSFSTAIKIADSNNIEVVGIDMDEESFTDSYTKNISFWNTLSRGRLEKNMVKKGIEGNTPEDIAINMENSIRRISGFAKLEEQRVKTMCENLGEYLDKKRILAVIELPNVASLIELLKES